MVGGLGAGPQFINQIRADCRLVSVNINNWLRRVYLRFFVNLQKNCCFIVVLLTVLDTSMVWSISSLQTIQSIRRFRMAVPSRLASLLPTRSRGFCSENRDESLLLNSACEDTRTHIRNSACEDTRIHIKVIKHMQLMWLRVFSHAVRRNSESCE